MAATADIMSPRERSKWLGYQGSVLLAAQLGGPALGGLITDTAGWRWGFFISLPFGVAALVIVWFGLKIPPNARRHTLDYVGAALLAGALVSGLLAATWGGQEYAWASPIIVSLFATSVVLAFVFAWWERRVAEPILPLELYKNRTFCAAQVIIFGAGCCMWSITTYIPLLAQGALGKSAAASGALLTPFMITSFVAGTLLGQLMGRTGRFRWQLFVGPVIVFTGFVLLGHMDDIPSESELIRNLVIVGLGMAMGNAIQIAVQNAMPQNQMGVVSAGNQFARVIGGTIMLTVLGAVMTSRVHAELAARLPEGSRLRNVPGQELIAHKVPLRGDEEQIVHAALGAAIPTVFTFLLPIVAIGFFAAFLVPRATLRGTISDAPEAEPAPVAAAAPPAREPTVQPAGQSS
jgi:MFS family permease